MFGINKEIEVQECAQGIAQKVLTYSDSLMMVEVSFKKDAEDGLHYHPHEQISYISKGSFRFVLDGEEKVVEAGDSILIPSDTPHNAFALEDASMVNVFTPYHDTIDVI